jgi:hypothetical protein
LQGRVDRAGAGSPQVLAALSDLLDHLVAVHRSLGQQHQDRGTDVATAAAPTVSATPSSSTARARAEAEAESAGPETPAEAGSETRAETRSERPVMAGVVVTADVVAELATGLPALFVQCTPCMRSEAKEVGALCSGTPGERPLYMGEWVVHMSSRFWKGSAGSATDTKTIYRELSLCKD